MWAVVGLQILFLQLLLHFHFSSLYMSQFRACDFLYPISLFKYFKRVDISAFGCLKQKTKGSWWLCTSRWSSQHFSNVTCPNILVDVVSSDHRVCSINDSTSNSTSHAIARDDFTRPRSLVAGYLHRYNNCRYYCWAEKLMLCRIWTLQTKPTIYKVSMSIANTTTAWLLQLSKLDGKDQCREFTVVNSVLYAVPSVTQI